MTTLTAFQRDLERALSVGSDLTVDLADVTFIDAAGIRALAETDARLRGEDRRLRVVRPSRNVRRMLGVLRLQYLVEQG
ncbi:STAS domain-containing protein [Actinoplanes sp. CA-030573]|uniref:STAS domain-containing protein n=1 Tax=Actinoplanes sp. CA-030573 TaxID=3239898 RepID=UPI003D8F8C96